MKKIISVLIIVIILFGMFSSAACGKENPDTSFRVMSFNIRIVALEEDTKNNWENRKDFVYDTVIKYDADLIGFQELKNNQALFLQEQLSNYGYYWVDRTGTVFGEAVGIFYKKSRFEVLSEEVFWLSETPDKVSKGWDAEFPRICVVLKLKDLISGKIIYHFNTHYDHKGVTAIEKSTALLLDRIGDKENVLVTGDFNLREGTANYNTLVAGVLNDAKYLAPECCSDTGGTSHGFGKRIAEMPIDFIFMTDIFKVSRYQIVRDQREGYYPSDHFPIYADIDYKG